MDRMVMEEGEVIQHSMITKSIERAQKKVEENNFGIRKRLRIPKLFSSTFFWARSMDLVIMECCITSPSSITILSIRLCLQRVHACAWCKSLRAASSLRHRIRASACGFRNYFLPLFSG